jgi:hypothetical protein
MPRLNSLPHTIVVYASQWSSPSTTQHSLPGGSYALPGPDLHRLEHASLLGARTRYLSPRIAAIGMLSVLSLYLSRPLKTASAAKDLALLERGATAEGFRSKRRDEKTVTTDLELVQDGSGHGPVHLSFPIQRRRRQKPY